MTLLSFPDPGLIVSRVRRFCVWARICKLRVFPSLSLSLSLSLSFSRRKKRGGRERTEGSLPEVNLRANAIAVKWRERQVARESHRPRSGRR